MSIFSHDELSQLSAIVALRKAEDEKERMERIIPHVLGEMLRLINKEELLNKLKNACAESTWQTFDEIRVDLFSFPPTVFSRIIASKVYWLHLIRDTTLLERLGNLLGCGHFECRKRTEVFPIMNPEEDDGNRVVIWAKFFPVKREKIELSCCRGSAHRHTVIDGLCSYCGSYTKPVVEVKNVFQTPPRPNRVEVAPGAPQRLRHGAAW